MKYLLRGNLRGFYCSDCFDYLSKTKVKVYSVENAADVTALAIAREKQTFHQRSDEELKRIAKNVLAETETDDAGNFVIELGETKNYSGGAFDIDFECGNVPIKIPFPPRPKGPFQFHITTLQPAWKKYENNAIAEYRYSIESPFFCRILALYDVWAVCGYVKDCETKRPIAGVKVFAYDVDWLQDDALGNAVTDANGKFIIYYPGDNFRQTLLSPWLNVEWPAGPDYYFKIVEPVSGITLLQEDRSVGHRADRTNRGNCFCVNLCVDSKNIPQGNYFPALFERVGAYDILTDFTANGYTNSGNNAFTSTIPLLGQLPSGTNSNSMEYRFRIINADTNYELSPAQVKSALPPFKIGELLKQIAVSPFIIHPDVTINPAVDADANGWIKVPRDNDFSVGGIGIFSPNGGVLALLDTTKVALDNSNSLFAKDDFDITIPAPPLKAGTAVPPAKRANIHTFKIIFEAREVGSMVLSASNELSKIVLCNVSYKQRRHPSWGYSGDVTLFAAAMLEIHETTAADAGCGAISNTVTADYTCCHPHMESLNIYLEGNPVLPPVFNQNLMPVDEANGNHVFNTAGLGKCAYILWLELVLRLTSGYGRIYGSTIYDHIAFCKV